MDLLTELDENIIFTNAKYILFKIFIEKKLKMATIQKHILRESRGISKST